MSEPILSIHNIQKSYGDFQAVKGISFDVRKGEIFSLLGPNGAGKTTLISMLSCLLKPTSGDAQIGSHSITQNTLAVKQLIGVVPQDLALYETLTAQQNLRFWGEMYGMSGESLNKRIGEVLEQVTLTDRANKRVNTFSGGMKRRLNIAVGLLHKPQLVFMDEPTVGIDPQSRRSILDMVKDLHAQGMTVLYTTHYMEEAEELSDRVGIVDQGKLIAIGSQKELTQMVGQQQTLRLNFGEEALSEAFVHSFKGIEGVVTAVTTEQDLVLNVQDAAAALPKVVAMASHGGQRIRTIQIVEPNLEAVFLHLTGRALRD